MVVVKACRKAASKVGPSALKGARLVALLVVPRVAWWAVSSAGPWGASWVVSLVVPMEVCWVVAKVDPLVWRDASSVDGSVVERAGLRGSVLAARRDDCWAANWAVQRASK